MIWFLTVLRRALALNKTSLGTLWTYLYQLNSNIIFIFNIIWTIPIYYLKIYKHFKLLFINKPAYFACIII